MGCFSPQTIPSDTLPYIVEVSGKRSWNPIYQHACTFQPEIFISVMRNLVQNPNINSSCLFRADVKDEFLFSSDMTEKMKEPAKIAQFKGFDLKNVIIRTLIPRNALLDKPLDESCLQYEQRVESSKHISMVVYLPHVSSASEMPYYHPAVYGICFLHEFSPRTKNGNISIHYCFFDSQPRSTKLERTAFHLLAILYKHGQGNAAGYVKRVFHDVLLPQNLVQNTYSRLKSKYSKKLIERWVESTDPTKHVFEDLGIAAFLIELWKKTYTDGKFPGFVDIGCGNGLLVHILREEGYSGWGFDARYRKSWSTYSVTDQENLKERILIPFILQSTIAATTLESGDNSNIDSNKNAPKGPEKFQKLRGTENPGYEQGIKKNFRMEETHDGIFPTSPFIISNHADELTPWTPLLATASKSAFIMIPCCSHNLSGARFCAPPLKKDTGKPSKYASLVAWVSQIAMDCGWEVEKEILRIPSTRNTAIIGRIRARPYEDINLKMVMERHGGAADWEKYALKLLSNRTKSKYDKSV
ncbi:tRNA -methyltransferase [Golovinomyces cichoracearum]|uniref:tRNA (uracil-O(2)-)-methyltransferase n=1 Tax=Golovinomyces cichoracearum TaxID=62708 RepID=A0A420J595_9PEZI|nr:tRNA -methyltransferase [Golovinomyces cichoracearum]